MSKHDVDCQRFNTDNESQPTLGERLTLARQQAGLSVDDVATKLFLSIAVVNQLETDSVPLSANSLFTKGYVKSYCTLLELPSDELLLLFKHQYQCQNDIKKMQTFSNRSKNTTHNNYLNWITLFVISIMVIGIIAWWWQQSEQEAQLALVSGIENRVQTTEPSPRLPLTPKVTNSVSNSKLVNTTLVFNKDCWVKITDSTNAVIAVGIKKAGSMIDISGVAPLEVILGAPLAVDITFEQQKLDISSYISNDTAKFTLPLEQ